MPGRKFGREWIGPWQQVRHRALLPIDFLNLGFAGTLTISSVGGREDELLVNATDPANLDAIFTVTVAGTIT